MTLPGSKWHEVSGKCEFLAYRSVQKLRDTGLGLTILCGFMVMMRHSRLPLAVHREN